MEFHQYNYIIKIPIAVYTCEPLCKRTLFNVIPFLKILTKINIKSVFSEIPKCTFFVYETQNVCCVNISDFKILQGLAILLESQPLN